MTEYYNVTTNIGDAEIANAIATNTKLNITHIAFGDGNGSVPTPSKSRTSLVHEVHRQAVTKYERHKTNANWIVIETIIPSEIGGFTIREMGVIANGKLISHGSHAPYEKVADPTGVSEYRLRFTQNITDGSVVELTLDESLIYATQAWVDEYYVPRDEVIDNLTTNDATKPVSAKQAKLLQDNKLDKTANAVSATKLQTARTIALSGGVTGTATSFDGSGNISIPVTDIDGSKITTGTIPAARIPTLNQSTTGNAATATKLQTARTINGVAFDGTANINLPTASTSTSGTVQLNNTLTSTSTTQALTAAQGKKLQDEKLPYTGGTLTGPLTLPNLIATGGVKGSLTHDSSYLIIHPYNESYNDGSVLRFYWDGNNSQLVAGKSGGSNAKPILHNMDLSGNAASATKLATARTIALSGGVTGTATSFDGSGNISIPVTDIDGSKITTGTIPAARIPTLNQSTTGNAATATKLATARTINGVSFDGTANITIPTMGNGQTWQDVKTSRAINTTYTNSTSRPIIVNIAWNYEGGGDNYAKFLVDGISVARGYAEPGDGVSIVVPAGSTYRYTSLGWGFSSWREYR